jgi:pyruvate/2-oxoglutarate dehydrogenase complex dihydrolipoamide acyltransferase (E2) component
VKVGDMVEVGQVLCIVEAMKLMNEIESDVAGEVVKRIAASGQPVEYGQPLFAIKAAVERKGGTDHFDSRLGFCSDDYRFESAT